MKGRTARLVGITIGDTVSEPGRRADRGDVIRDLRKLSGNLIEPSDLFWRECHGVSSI